MLILDSVRQARADQIALEVQGKTLSYGELENASNQLARRLAPFNSRPIGLLAPASFEYFIGLLAIWKAGGLAVPLPPTHPLEELRHITSDSGLAQILCASATQDLAQKLAPTLVISHTPNDTSRPLEPTPERDAHAPVLMIYTSGTTGRAKGVISSQRTLDAQIRLLVHAWQWSATDRTLNILPLHHIHGVVVVAGCALAAGARMELAEKFTPELVWQRLASGAINVFMAVPTVYAKLAQHWSQQTASTQEEWSTGLRRMRLLVSGSAALPAPLYDTWKNIAGQPLLERYGMTEIGIALSNSALPARRRRGHVGQPLPGVDVRLVDESGATVTACDTAGELQVRGESIFSGYWHQPEVTRESFSADGWFKTGDLAEFNGEGDFRILGRLSQDIIKTGGYKVSALEIESGLLEHPDIKEVAVLGMADETWGERVAAVLVLAADAVFSEAAARAFLQPRLARYKWPTEWRVVTALPRNAMGKVIKKELGQLF